MNVKQIGKYQVVEARSLTTGERSWRVYAQEAIDPISEHPTKGAAVSAAMRYIATDNRRRA